MMLVLLDVNVLLDAFLARGQFYADALAVLQANDEGKLVIYVAATSLPNIFYLGRAARKGQGYLPEDARRSAYADVLHCLASFQIIWFTEQVMQTALAQTGSDLEDNLQLASAITANLDAIVTRDAKFAGAAMTILTPAQLLQRI